MAVKWTGIFLVIFSAGGFGVWSAMEWKGRLRLLELLRQMIYFLKGEITYSHAPIAEALERVGKRTHGPLGELFTGVAQNICNQEGESLQEIWQSERTVQALYQPWLHGRHAFGDCDVLVNIVRGKVEESEWVLI